jgi:hypothetical protein
MEVLDTDTWASIINRGNEVCSSLLPEKTPKERCLIGYQALSQVTEFAPPYRV